MNPVSKKSVSYFCELPRVWVLYLYILFLLFVLVGCADDNDADAEKLRFMVFGDPAERAAYLELVDAFHQKYPGIEVQVNHIPSPRDYRTRLATEYAAGSAPDVSLMNYRRYASFAAKELLEPLGPYLAESSEIESQDFYPATIDAFTWQGELMCIPQNVSSLVVYYNADLFDEAGIGYPADDWTWDQFLETAKALTKDLDDDGTIDQYGLGLEPSLFRFAPFVWQNKGQIVDNDYAPNLLTLDQPFALEALQWVVDLQEVHGVLPGRIEEAAIDSESRFISGMTAMYLNSRRGTPSYREIDSFTWDIAPLPIGKTKAGILHSDAYCLSQTSGAKEAAWKFIEFANSIKGQTIIANSGRTVPSLTSVAESTVFLDPNMPPSRAYVFLENAPFLRRVPVISTWEEIEDIASQELERAFYGDVSLEEAARLAVQRTDEYFNLARYAGQP
ncbi:MAG TPA: sugar ABC transporter substrate-binding protein [candidate division Zixibacteria bacterium]|nr:sugar ABC transporter substrate-binding protein [candidate division Zixibacteria bacterium]